MKSILKFLMLFVAIFAAAAIFAANPSATGLIVASMVAIWLTNVMVRPQASLFMATLSVNEILMDTLDAFTQMVPYLGAFSTDFSSKTAKKGDTITAHISALPSVQSYDNTTGYKANAADVTNLITDVPVILDQLKHVPVKVGYLSQLASRKNLYQEAIRNQAYVIGKSIVDYAIGKMVAANFSQKLTIATGDSDFLNLEAARTALNVNKAAPVGRFGLVNSAVSAVMQADVRLSSKDYYGQLTGGEAYRHWKAVSGFENIWEYPDFPTTENLTGFYGDRRAVTIASRIPTVDDAKAILGLPNIAKFETVSHPESGLTLLGIGWQEPGTFDVYLTIAALYGASAGKQGGATGAITDYAGLRQVTS